MEKHKLIKKTDKSDREKRILLALVEQYIRAGKPIGSETLRETDLKDLSAATIRNYFARLEANGYLLQQHTSGGRIPTHKAFRLYAKEHLNSSEFSAEAKRNCNKLRLNESKEVTSYLQSAAEILSSVTQSAVFISAPRFDHDFITAIKLMAIDHTRSLCVIVTDFGAIKTEIVQTHQKLSAFSIKRIEEYFYARLTGQPHSQQKLEPKEQELAVRLYSELIVRYIVGYSNFSEAEVYRTGFSKLLAYPEFHDPSQLAASLSLFENSHSMRLLLKECTSHNALKFWIGDDLAVYTNEIPYCTVLAIPYKINNHPIGAVGLLSSVRIPYAQWIGLLYHFSETISENITRNMYKFKIKYRQPHEQPLRFGQTPTRWLEQASPLLLEDNRRSYVK